MGKRFIKAGISTVYNKKRQAYVPKLVMDVLGVDIREKLEWVVDLKTQTVEVKKADE